MTAVINRKEIFSSPWGGDLFLRENADRILFSHDTRPLFIDPQILPVAGLKSLERTIEGIPAYAKPVEVLHPKFRPVVIFDLDDTLWPHAIDLVRAISFASGIPATMEDLQTYGHSRKFPQWMNPRIDALQDAIQQGNHPDIYPFVNKAHDDAVRTVHAVERMGHNYAYLTARLPFLFDTTKRVLEWNRLPFDATMIQTDARMHPEPKRGFLYCSSADSSDVGKYKNNVVNMWLHTLRRAGWEGKMIIVDDTPKAFKEEIERGDVISIALEGPLNVKLTPFFNEMRTHSWHGIADVLQQFHMEAVLNDPSPVRRFVFGVDSPKQILEVDKTASGIGSFSLRELPADSYRFVEK